jgi:hypothetical protein
VIAQVERHAMEVRTSVWLGGWLLGWEVLVEYLGPPVEAEEAAAGIDLGLHELGEGCDEWCRRGVAREGCGSGLETLPRCGEGDRGPGVLLLDAPGAVLAEDLLDRVLTLGIQWNWVI